MFRLSRFAARFSIWLALVFATSSSYAEILTGTFTGTIVGSNDQNGYLGFGSGADTVVGRTITGTVTIDTVVASTKGNNGSYVSIGSGNPFWNWMPRIPITIDGAPVPVPASRDSIIYHSPEQRLNIFDEGADDALLIRRDLNYSGLNGEFVDYKTELTLSGGDVFSEPSIPSSISLFDFDPEFRGSNKLRPST